jgi:signal transduction histidine kinase
VDEKSGVLKRVALSQTKEAQEAQLASAVPFHQIEIPLHASDNLLIKTLQTKEPQITHDWPELFTPVLTPDEARANQHASGIQTSLLYPVTVKGKAIGAVIFSMVKHEAEISEDERDLIAGFSDIIGLAVQNARLYTSLDETSRELKIANEKLKELDKLKDEFVSIASHELRTPMVSIKNYVWMTLAGKGGKITPKQQFYLNRAYESSNRMTKLINDLLNISRIESGRILLNVEKAEILEIADAIVSEMQPKADQLEVSLNIDRQAKKKGTDQVVAIPPVIADKDKVAEVIVNFLSNSLKFTPPQGTITISFEVDDVAQQVLLHVTDTGVGLTPDQIPKLFKKFGMLKETYRTKTEAAQGTGLGLYVSKSIIELHGGKIGVVSEGQNKGSKFSFSLPFFSQIELEKLQKKFESGADAGIIRTQLVSNQ